MNTPVTVEYYTDVLCIWAWVSELRVQQLKKDFGDSIEIKAKYMDVFGDVNHKMNTTWRAKDGFNGFSEHIQKTAESFPELKVNATLWKTSQPSTSAVAHMYIKAVHLIEGEVSAQKFALAIREAFYINAQNISKNEVLENIAQTQGLHIPSLKQAINDGNAMAALMNDYQMAKTKNLQGSPTFILDNGRQTLFGNVNYRVLKANIESLLQADIPNSPSWY